MTASCAYVGTVRHRRFEPVEHEFSYPMFLPYLDLDELPRVLAQTRLWSASRPALARFRRGDFLGDPAVPLADAAREVARREAGAAAAGPVRMLASLRYFGHAFNPVAFYFCFRPDGADARRGRRRGDQHALGRAACVRRCARRGARRGRAAAQGVPRLPADGDGPRVRVAGHAARASGWPCTSCPRVTAAGSSTRPCPYSAARSGGVRWTGC